MVTDAPTAKEAAVINRHFAYLERLLDEGVMILVVRTQNNDARTMGLVIFNADDDAASQQIMMNDPAILGGIMTAEVFPYRVALIREANVRDA
jgi:uncharacterized protein